MRQSKDKSCCNCICSVIWMIMRGADVVPCLFARYRLVSMLVCLPNMWKLTLSAQYLQRMESFCLKEMLCNSLWWWSWDVAGLLRCKGGQLGMSSLLFISLTCHQGTWKDLTRHQPTTKEHRSRVFHSEMNIRELTCPKVTSCFLNGLVYICLVHSNLTAFHFLNKMKIKITFRFLLRL